MVGQFEKSEQVLWAFIPDGIVLHNFNRGEFVELTGLDAQVWAYCDGSRTLAEICTLLATKGGGDDEEAAGRVKCVFDDLLSGGFLVERVE